MMIAIDENTCPVYKIKCGNWFGSGLLVEKNKIITVKHVVQEHFASDETITIYYSSPQDEPNAYSFTPSGGKEVYKDETLVLLESVGDFPAAPIKLFSTSCEPAKTAHIPVYGFMADKYEQGEFDLTYQGRTSRKEFRYGERYTHTLSSIHSIDYSGLSGSPVFYENCLIGIAGHEDTQDSSRLNALCLSTFYCKLSDFGITLPNHLEFTQVLHCAYTAKNHLESSLTMDEFEKCMALIGLQDAYAFAHRFQAFSVNADGTFDLSDLAEIMYKKQVLPNEVNIQVKFFKALKTLQEENNSITHEIPEPNLNEQLAFVCADSYGVQYRDFFSKHCNAFPQELRDFDNEMNRIWGDCQKGKEDISVRLGNAYQSLQAVYANTMDQFHVFSGKYHALFNNHCPSNSIAHKDDNPDYYKIFAEKAKPLERFLLVEPAGVPFFPQRLVLLSTLYSIEHNYEASEKYAGEALKQCQSMSDNDSKYKLDTNYYADILCQLAEADIKLKQYQKALNKFLAALNHRHGVVNNSANRLCYNHRSIAYCYSKTGDLSEALVHARKTLELHLEMFTPGNTFMEEELQKDYDMLITGHCVASQTNCREHLDRAKAYLDQMKEKLGTGGKYSACYSEHEEAIRNAEKLLADSQIPV